MLEPMPNISELWTKTERLDPELRKYKRKDALGYSIRHPLLYDIYYLPKRNAEFNYRLKFKKQLLAEALEKKKYHQYVLHYERPYCLQAIQNLIDQKNNFQKRYCISYFLVLDRFRKYLGIAS